MLIKVLSNKVKFLILLAILIIYIILINYKRPFYFNDELPLLKKREDFGSLMESLQFKSMIEIGVLHGEFANNVLKNWPSMSVYYGIDPGYQSDAPQNLALFGNKIKLIKNFSISVESYFQPESIDFIYIDAAHDYCSVYNELNVYYLKLKCNGIIAGHDYKTAEEMLNIRKNKPSDQKGTGLHWTGLECSNGTVVKINGGGVKGAVIEFAKEKDIPKIMETNEPWPSFYFRKKC
jgi:hypothetical protein